MTASDDEAGAASAERKDLPMLQQSTERARERLEPLRRSIVRLLLVECGMGSDSDQFSSDIDMLERHLNNYASATEWLLAVAESGVGGREGSIADANARNGTDKIPTRGLDSGALVASLDASANATEKLTTTVEAFVSSPDHESSLTDLKRSIREAEQAVRGLRRHYLGEVEGTSNTDDWLTEQGVRPPPSRPSGRVLESSATIAPRERGQGHAPASQPCDESNAAGQKLSIGSEPALGEGSQPQDSQREGRERNSTEQALHALYHQLEAIRAEQQTLLERFARLQSRLSAFSLFLLFLIAVFSGVVWMRLEQFSREHSLTVHAEQEKTRPETGSRSASEERSARLKALENELKVSEVSVEKLKIPQRPNPPENSSSTATTVIDDGRANEAESEFNGASSTDTSAENASDAKADMAVLAEINPTKNSDPLLPHGPAAVIPPPEVSDEPIPEAILSEARIDPKQKDTAIVNSAAPTQPSPAKEEDGQEAPSPPTPSGGSAVPTQRRQMRVLESKSYGIQLIALQNSHRIARFAEELALGNDAVYTRLPHKRGGWYVVLFQIFPTRKEAVSALQALPARLKSLDPIVSEFAAGQELFPIR